MDFDPLLVSEPFRRDARLQYLLFPLDIDQAPPSSFPSDPTKEPFEWQTIIHEIRDLLDQAPPNQVCFRAIQTIGTIPSQLRSVMDRVMTCTQYLAGANMATPLQFAVQAPREDDDDQEIIFQLAAGDPEQIKIPRPSICLGKIILTKAVSESFSKRLQLMIKISREDSFFAIIGPERTYLYDAAACDSSSASVLPSQTVTGLLCLIHERLLRKDILREFIPNPPFPFGSIIGCETFDDPPEDMEVVHANSFSELSFYDLRTSPKMLDAFENWHTERQRIADDWINNKAYPGTSLSLRRCHDLPLPSSSISTHLPFLWLSTQDQDPPRRCLEYYKQLASKHVRPRSSVPFSPSALRILGAQTIGMNRWSQTFKVQVLDGQGKAMDDVFLLKLFDERLFPLPRYESFLHLRPMFEKWKESATLVQNEAHAYTTLSFLQGSALPYSYGFFEVNLSDKCSCVGHLMEFINGTDLAALDMSDWTLAQKRDLMTLSAATVTIVNAFGIIHGDIRNFHNIIYRRVNDSARSQPFWPVLIDFAQARDIEESEYIPNDALVDPLGTEDNTDLVHLFIKQHLPRSELSAMYHGERWWKNDEQAPPGLTSMDVDPSQGAAS